MIRRDFFRRVGFAALAAGFLSLEEPLRRVAELAPTRPGVHMVVRSVVTEGPSPLNPLGIERLELVSQTPMGDGGSFAVLTLTHEDQRLMGQYKVGTPVWVEHPAFEESLLGYSDMGMPRRWVPARGASWPLGPKTRFALDLDA